MKRIPLANGGAALVDDEDFERLNVYRWKLHTSPSGKEYAVRNRLARERGMSVFLRMHQMVIGGRGVDHRNGNTLDNRRSNLRIATDAQNQQNRRTITNKHGFKGVAYHGYTQNNGKRWIRRKPWKAEIQVDQKRIHLGHFLSAEEAAAAYDRAAVLQFGEFAATNAELLGLA